MRVDGIKFSGLGFIVGVVLYELYHKSSKGSW